MGVHDWGTGVIGVGGGYSHAQHKRFDFPRIVGGGWNVFTNRFNNFNPR